MKFLSLILEFQTNLKQLYNFKLPEKRIRIFLGFLGTSISILYIYIIIIIKKKELM